MESLKFCGDVWLPAGSIAGFPTWACEGLIINLEGPITTSKVHQTGKICLSTDPIAFANAFPSRPLAACLANNHIMDYGEDGFEDTVKALRKMGVLFFGAGTSDLRCHNPLIISHGKVTFGLLGYVCPSTHPIWAAPGKNGVSPIDLKTIKKDIDIAREQGATKLIVSLHWGQEEVWLPKPDDIETAKRILDCGVDLIIGHHAHCRQPVYTYNSKRVFFGLGNAQFPDFEYHESGHLIAWSKQRKWNRTSLLVTVSMDGSVFTQSVRDLGSGIPSIEHSKRPISTWNELPVEADPGYIRRYRRAWRFAMMRLALSRFAARPRLPRRKSLLGFFKSIIKTA